MPALESQDTRAMQAETTDFLVDLADDQSHEDTFVSLLHDRGQRSGESRTVCIHGEQHDLCLYWRCNWLVLGFFSSAAGVGPDSRLGIWQSRRFGNRQCG